MTPPSLPPDMLAALPPAVQAYIRHLEARLADLEAHLRQDSSNSSKPPSSDPPSAKPAPPRTPSGRLKGGQPGHPRHARPDLPPDEVVELRADACDRCRGPLSTSHPFADQYAVPPPARWSFRTGLSALRAK